jgi:hypothetical protein
MQPPPTGVPAMAPPAPEQLPPPYGENNEDLPEPLQTKLKELARKFCDEDKFSRRLEIQSSRRAHFFWRTLQHLYWDGRAEGWVPLGASGAPMIGERQSYNQDSAVLYSTNIYQPYGLTLIAVLTQSIPAVIAVPDDGEDAADLATAKAGNKFRKIVEQKNDATMLMTKAMFFAYVDGRIVAWTRNEKNVRTNVVETKISMHGSLEAKVPMTPDCRDDMVYVQISWEQHVAMAKAANPKFKRKIRGGAQGAGQDVYERTARVSVAQGTSYMSGSGDTLTNLSTVQTTLMRPAAFELLESDANDSEDPDVMQLKQIFPTGCRVKLISGEYVGSWDEDLDDHIEILNPLPGDGQFRNSMGHTTESVQERFNDIINIAQETYEKTLPAIYADVKMQDPNATFQQVSKPGNRIPCVKVPGEPIAESFYAEPPASVSPDMLAYGDKLMNEVPQLTTGAFTALMGGGNAKGAAGDTASGYAMQKEQAMGRMGLVYRAMKRWWAGIMGQAVKCAALLKADMSMSIPDNAGNVETTTVRIEELQGNVHWYPESDEGIPTTWSEKKATYMGLLTAADANPLLAKILSDPRNQEVGQDLIGLEDLVVPGAEAWAKQMLEINELLKGGPQPNPQFEQLQTKLVQMQQHSMGGGMHDDNDILQIGMQLEQTPPQNPTVPIDAQCDFNAEEWDTVQIFMTSSRGLKEKAENPEGFANVRLHGLLHKMQTMKDQAAMAPLPPPARMPHPGAKPAAPKPPQAAAA